MFENHVDEQKITPESFLHEAAHPDHFHFAEEKFSISSHIGHKGGFWINLDFAFSKKLPESVASTPPSWQISLFYPTYWDLTQAFNGFLPIQRYQRYLIYCKCMIGCFGSYKCLRLVFIIL